MLPALLFGQQGIVLSRIFNIPELGKPSEFVELVRKNENNPEFIRKHILTKFKKMNDTMLNDTQKSYPEPVLERLAAMTADCLSMDPVSRPTAEQLLLGLQNMGLSDWRTEDANKKPLTPTYTYMPQPQPGSPEAQIQGEFWWINPPPAIH
jgi:hypothetical protein